MPNVLGSHASSAMSLFRRALIAKPWNTARLTTFKTNELYTLPQLRKLTINSAAAVNDEGSLPSLQPPPPPPPPSRLGKRKVALFVGYEGTAYRGLQTQPTTAPDETIEDAVTRAIYSFGGILKSNLGDLSKLRWSRSSRTDKRVHSLSTVLAMKMECDSEAFDSDPEGINLARKINAHLPDSIKIFSVQRVSKKFDARRECIRRTYHYHLPAPLLGLKGDGGAEDAAKLQALEEVWKLFEGNRPFHNYTKRRLYRFKRKAKGLTHRDAASESDEEDEGEEEEESILGAPIELDNEDLTDVIKSTNKDSSLDPSQDSLSAFANSEDPEGRRFRLQLIWKAEREDKDPILRRHYRYIASCSVSPELVTPIPGGTPCVRLTVCGASFMLHQIRHMVGAVVAVSLGVLPLELVKASMSAPTRINLPLAPPSTLILGAAEFAPFKRSWDGKPAAASQWTGDHLELQAGGQEEQQKFADEFLMPAVSELLGGEEWETWGEQLRQVWYDKEEMKEFLMLHEEWKVEKAARKEARLEAALEAAAAQSAEHEE